MTTREPHENVQLPPPEQPGERRVSEILAALAEEHRGQPLPEFTADDWEATARHALARLEREQRR